MSVGRRPLVTGNWKMNGRRASAIDLARSVASRVLHGHPACDICVCPPASLLFEVARALEAQGAVVALGGQDCSAETDGAHTGDISAEMLADAGCRYVIVGHSERRTDHKEVNALVAAKAERALNAGLIPIVCVGETLEQRKKKRTLSTVATQVGRSVPEGVSGDSIVVAYEPVWAIGTGHTPTVKDISKVHAHIREHLSRRLEEGTAEHARVLYGGSVKAANAQEILSLPEVDGALVGGASLNADEFWAICCAAT
jgi:triosephosphate isomerase